MTPKEALDGLAQFIIMNDTGTDESASAIEWHDILKQALNELERLKKFKETFDNYELAKKQDFIAYENWIECEAELKKLPTAKEVCEALSEYDDFDEVNYRVSTRGFYSNDIICYLGMDHQEKPIIIFEYDLPPHLITLIGRFYEGEIK